MLTAGVLALLAARRRLRLRAAQPRARLPVPPPELVAIERRLRAVDAGERLLRVDIAVRAAAASLLADLDGSSQVAVVRVGPDGEVELTLTGAASLPAPWTGDGACWRLPGAVPIELLAEPARSVGAPCVALAQIGVDAEGRDVLVDLEALGLLTVAAPAELADEVVKGIAATLATLGVRRGRQPDRRGPRRVGVPRPSPRPPGRPRRRRASSSPRRCSGRRPCLRSALDVRAAGAAHRRRGVGAGGRASPAPPPRPRSTADLVRSASVRRGGLAMVVAGESPGAPWSLRADDRRWVLEPLGITLVPVGLTAREVDEIHDVLRHADAPLVADEAGGRRSRMCRRRRDELREPTWALLVRLLGPVEVVDRDGRVAHVERSKTLELIAWLALHRDHSTRAGARTALWDLDVRDATFANVVSEARRAMARLVAPPDGEEWLGRTLTEVLPLHEAVVADVDLLRARLDRARLQPPELAIETLRPAVELIRDMPFAGTGYLWPDAEGITSNLVLLATGAATELAGHCLSMGDVDGVFWATGQGLKVLAGHEELIALRMRAHAKAGDLSGVRLEWETYERVLHADPWSDGEPAPKLVTLRRELLSP